VSITILQTNNLQAVLHPSELETEPGQRVRELLRQVKMQLREPSYLDARWLVGLAVGRDAPVFGHESLFLTPAQLLILMR